MALKKSTFPSLNLLSIVIGFGASQGRPHVASLSFLTNSLKVRKRSLKTYGFFSYFWN